MLWAILTVSVLAAAISFQALRFVMTVIENQQKLFHQLEDRFAEVKAEVDEIKSSLGYASNRADEVREVVDQIADTVLVESQIHWASKDFP